MRAPHIYSEWIELISAIKDKANDEEVLAAAKAGTLEWQVGVAERFTEEYLAAINYRIDCAISTFQKNYRQADTDGMLVKSLLRLRKDMKFLADLLNIQAIPEKFRDKYVELVRNKANEIQSSLELSAKNDRTGHLLHVVKNNRVNVF